MEVQEENNVTVMRLTCNKGYTLVGSPVRLCNSSGTWQGKKPTCLGRNIHVLYNYGSIVKNHFHDIT